jgi:hypothetical protein
MEPVIGKHAIGATLVDKVGGQEVFTPPAALVTRRAEEVLAANGLAGWAEAAVGKQFSALSERRRGAWFSA